MRHLEKLNDFRAILVFFSVAKTTLESQMSHCLSVCPCWLALLLSREWKASDYLILGTGDFTLPDSGQSLIIVYKFPHKICLQKHNGSWNGNASNPVQPSRRVSYTCDPWSNDVWVVGLLVKCISWLLLCSWHQAGVNFQMSTDLIWYQDVIM